MFTRHTARSFETGSVGADVERERGDDDGGNGRRLARAARGIAEIEQERVEAGADEAFPDGVVRVVQPDEYEAVGVAIRQRLEQQRVDD